MKKKILILISLLLTLVLSGCGGKNNGDGKGTDKGGENNAKALVAGWEIEVLEHSILSTLENVNVILGYEDVATESFKKVATAGSEFVLLKLDIKKIDSSEEIDWSTLALIDDNGNEYNRIDDTFITDLGMKRLPGTNLNFGSHEGWICFEVKKGYEKIKVNYAFESEEYNYWLSIDSSDTAENEFLPPFEDYLAKQNEIDKNIIEESKKDYTIENPLVIVNPYGNSPLTALVIFNTESDTRVDITVKGKDSKDNIEASFDQEKTHILPIYGLYSGQATEVELKLGSGETKTLSIETEVLGEDIVVGEVTVLKEEHYDFSKLVFTSTRSENYSAFAFDSVGDIRFALVGNNTATPIRRSENGNILLSSTRLVEETYHYTGIIEIDLIGKVYADYMLPGGYHHDFFEMENGNLLVVGNPSDFSNVEDYITEIDRKTGEVVFELDLKTILNDKDGGSINRDDRDWMHINAIVYDEETDNILLSARHIDAIVAINKSKKELSWIIGDPRGWEHVDEKYFFTPVGGDDFEWQYAQHEVTVLSNGDIMCFDNGAGRTKVGFEDERSSGDDVYSRSVVYRIDTDAMTIEQVWQYGKERGREWYAPFISGSLDIGDNNTWITSGGILYDQENDTYDLLPSNMMGTVHKAHINQVKGDELVFELVLDKLTYRSTKLSIYADNPSFDVEKQGVYVGNLGETPFNEVDKIDFSKVEEDVIDVKMVENPDRFIMDGQFDEELKDAEVILRSGDGETRGYAIAEGEVDESTNKYSFNRWFSPIGLEGNNYQVYVRNNGKVYNTGYEVEK